MKLIQSPHIIDECELNPIYKRVQKIEHSKEDDIVIFIHGLLHNKKKTICFHILSLIFLGFPYLLLYWFPQLQRYKYDSNNLDEATDILIVDNFHLISIKRIYKLDCYLNDDHKLMRYFDYQHTRYVWNETREEFEKFTTLEKILKLNDLPSRGRGLTENQESELLKVYGFNKIEIEIKSYWNLFIYEVFHPFYVFQAFSVILWGVDEYIEYAACVFVISIWSIATSLYQTKKQSVALHELVENSNVCEMEVVRPNSDEKLIGMSEMEMLNLETVDACYLVPGDVIAIPRHGCVMPCDAIILSGNCIVNEAMLTGESIPVTKTVPNLSDEIYDSKSHRRHTLFSGTQVIQTRYYGNSRVLALVVGTGFSTSKGDLVKSILYPKPVNYKFFQDAMRFVGLLFIVALLGNIYCIYLYQQRNATFVQILLRVLDIITIIVPPALPAAMTSGIICSQSRLRKNGIFCISPLRINVAGRMKLVCFDKTGTLTNEGLHFYGVIPTNNSEFATLISDLSMVDRKDPLIQTLGVCHSLTRLEGKISGDPLEVKMFEATSWILEEPGSECSRYDQLAPTIVYPPGENSENFQFDSETLPYQIGLIRQFPFSSSQQSMSVIARILGNRHMTLYVKGAPEKIVKLCDSTTVPNNFESFLREYAMQGYRIIGLAYKNLDKKIRWKEALKIKREEIETNMRFLGLLIMQNTLKEETIPIIRELQNADIRNVMITGDNLMTAISVSQDCGLVRPTEHVVIVKTERYGNEVSISTVPKILFELVGSSTVAHNLFELFKTNSNTDINFRKVQYHFAMTGETWSVLREYYESIIPKLIIHGTIFARFAPEQKTQLVMCFQELDYVVGMVGDGANDCGALKAAHIGISLNDAEASVAAPFTSRIPNISCVKHIILEGRCALVTSFAIFKYMTLYSFIQFISILILYSKKSIFGNMEFLYIDLVITTTLAVTMGRQGPSSKMVSKRPMESLLSLRNIIPLASQVLMCMIFQLLAYSYLKSQDWYEPVILDLDSEDKEVVLSWENTVIFLMSSFQYISLALVYSTGKLHRRPVYTNVLLIINVLILSTFCGYLLVYPAPEVADFFEIVPIEDGHYWFRISLLIIPILHLITIFFIEFLANRKCWKNILDCLKYKRKPTNKYKELYNLVKLSDYWLTQSDFEVGGLQC